MAIKWHHINKYLIGCPHLITVQVIGCGGSGSQMLTALAAIHTSLVKTGRKGLYVEAFDPDTVSEANLGRQSFFPSDLGNNKARTLISRLNISLGLQWKAVPYTFSYAQHGTANIIITCVDNIGSRVTIEAGLENSKRATLNDYDACKAYYWLDLGNSKDTGQVILGTVRVPEFDKDVDSKRKLLRSTEMFDYSQMKEEKSGPSCSTMEALFKQDLFINRIIADTAGNILWKLLFNHKICYRGAYINLETGHTNPIPV